MFYSFLCGLCVARVAHSEKYVFKERLNYRSSIPSGELKFLVSTQPDCLWGVPSFLSSGFQGVFRWLTRRELESEHLPASRYFVHGFLSPLNPHVFMSRRLGTESILPLTCAGFCDTI